MRFVKKMSRSRNKTFISLNAGLSSTVNLYVGNEERDAIVTIYIQNSANFILFRPKFITSSQTEHNCIPYLFTTLPGLGVSGLLTDHTLQL